MTCSAGEVTSLVFPDGNIYNGYLYGSIPSELGVVSGLKALSARYNALTGTIPSELGALTAMTGPFILDYNGFSGSIPSELGRLTGLLTYVKLRSGGAWTGNGWSGSTGTALTDGFTGTIPSELGGMTQMKYWFDLGYNELTSVLPSSV